MRAAQVYCSVSGKGLNQLRGGARPEGPVMKTDAVFSELYEEGGSDAVAEDVSRGPGTKWGDWIVLLENCRCSTQMRQSFGLE